VSEVGWVCIAVECYIVEIT